MKLYSIFVSTHSITESASERDVIRFPPRALIMHARALHNSLAAPPRSASEEMEMEKRVHVHPSSCGDYLSAARTHVMWRAQFNKFLYTTRHKRFAGRESIRNAMDIFERRQAIYPHAQRAS